MWLIPTRNRAGMMKQLITTCETTGDVPEAAVMMDGCEYFNINWPQNWHIHHSTEHIEMGKSINNLLTLYPGRKSYGLLTDHSRPLSRDWSSTLEEEAGDWGMASSVNGKPRINKKTGKQRLDCFAIGGKLVEELGYIWHPSVVHMYADDILEDIGYGLDILRFIPEVKFDELQLRDGTLKADENSRRMFHGKFYLPLDAAAYAKWLELEYQPTLERLKRKMNES